MREERRERENPVVLQPALLADRGAGVWAVSFLVSDNLSAVSLSTCQSLGLRCLDHLVADRPPPDVSSLQPNNCQHYISAARV